MRPKARPGKCQKPQLLSEQFTPPDQSQSAWTCTKGVNRTRCHQLQRRHDWAESQFFLFFGCYLMKISGRFATEFPKWKIVTNTFHTFFSLEQVREGGLVAQMLICSYCWNYRSDGSLVIFSTALV